MTGGSQADARVSTPPRFGVFGLAALQSGYGNVGADCAVARRGFAPAANAVVRARVERKRRREVVAAIGLSFQRIGKDVAVTVPRRHRQVKPRRATASARTRSDEGSS